MGRRDGSLHSLKSETAREYRAAAVHGIDSRHTLAEILVKSLRSVASETRSSEAKLMSAITHFLIGWAMASTVPSLDTRDRALVTVTRVVPDIDGLGIVQKLVDTDPSFRT